MNVAFPCRPRVFGMTMYEPPPSEMSDKGADPIRRRERRAEQARLRTIVERVGDGIVVASLDGVIQFANPAAERLFGRRSNELCGSPLGFPAVVGESAEIEIIRPGGSAVAAELRAVETDWGDVP